MNRENNEFNQSNSQMAGNQVVQDNISTNPNQYNQNTQFRSPTNVSLNQIVPKKETLNTVSLVIGIISIVLSFLINILILPLAILGLILGVVNITKKGKKITGIILNAIAIVLSIIVLLILVFITKNLDLSSLFGKFINELNYKTSNNYVAGEYNCTDYMGNPGDYIATLHLNKDNTFLYGPYDDLKNNYAKGTYSYTDLEKTNSAGNFKYFMVTFDGYDNEFIIDGKPSERKFDSKMEIGITDNNGNREAAIMFTNTYNTYYCYAD